MPAAPRRRRRRAPAYPRFGVVAIVFVGALATLGVVLLLTSSAGSSRPATTSAPSPGAAESRATGGPPGGKPAAAPQSTQGPPPTRGPTPPPTQAPLRVEIAPLEPNYTVEPGDTLGQIARRAGTTVEALQALNRLEDTAVLRVGQRLIVPRD